MGTGTRAADGAAQGVQGIQGALGALGALDALDVQKRLMSETPDPTRMEQSLWHAL
ncbi:hypothetical protein OG413_34420 [Streptomyces sp. NBC_01433]|uniref:hypothetical protein n=1 Tax=Streptomyces sp. NBC_01433 TaxID=2903864 RepID=UPI0022532658|nr:hypothetical protein [Streptomyces sp. NBC_01433]MCX4680313.1 hypothetical protein [Streptomyces sp. NBC_01433]